MTGETPARPPSLKIVPYHGQSQVGKRKRRWTQGDEMSARGPLSKIKNACNTCREKKTRCSGHQPCVRCKRHGQRCEYMPTAATTVPERVSRPGHSEQEPSPTHTVSSSESRNRQAVPSDEAGVSPVRASPEVLAPADTPDEALQEDQYGHLHGGASEFAFLQYAKQKLASLPAMSIYFSDYPLEGLGKFAPMLPPRPIAEDLLKTYFEFGLTTSRFVHKSSFVQLFDQLYSGVQELSWDTLALVYMVLALGSHYSRVDDMFSGYSASIRFYEMASKQLQQDPDKITFTALQARMLVTHYLLNHAKLHEAWSSFGTLVRHAQALGLHRRSIGAPKDFIVHEYRKRLFWTIYINDRVLGSIFGRPCAIHDDDIDQEECAYANDDDISTSSCIIADENTFCSTAALIHYSRLTQILGRILKSLYSPAARLRPINRLNEVATQYERSLTEWQDNLPPYLNYVILPQSALSVMTQRQTCTLKLTFAHASMLLYRPFILYSIGSTADGTASLGQWARRCHDKALEAAKLVVSECHYLLQQGLFSRVFWMVNYVQFAAIGTLYMYSHLWPGATDARETAAGALAEFSIGVEGDPVGQRYVEILNELKTITAGAGLDSVDWERLEVPAEHWSDGNLAMFDTSFMDFGGSWPGVFLETGSLDPGVSGGIN